MPLVIGGGGGVCVCVGGGGGGQAKPLTCYGSRLVFQNFDISQIMCTKHPGFKGHFLVVSESYWTAYQSTN